MLSNALQHSNPFIRYGTAALMVFGPLYLANSYGVSFAWNAALAIGLAVFVWRFGGFGG